MAKTKKWTKMQIINVKSPSRSNVTFNYCYLRKKNMQIVHEIFDFLNTILISQKCLKYLKIQIYVLLL